MTPQTARSAAEQQHLDAALVELFEHKITFNGVLGLKVESTRAGDVRARLPMRPELVGHHGYGRLHGGVVSAVLDALGGLALMAAIAERHPAENTLQVMNRFSRMGTIDLRIDFLRQGLGASFVATAEVTRLGGRIGNTQMRLVNDEGALIATGAATYILT
ncbi:MAG: thioesterase family protein [Burkholderiales bacterium]|nr:thioesterase family protein [Burkholderiales bacterium]